MTPRTIAKEGLRLSRLSQSWRIFELMVGILLFVCSWFVMSVVPFQRRNFGERFLSWGNLWFGYTAVATFMFIGAFIPGHSPHEVTLPFFLFPVSIPMLVCYLAFIVLSLWHRLMIWARNQEGVEWHSFSQGESWLSDILADRDEDGDIKSRPSEEAIHKWGEPIIITGIGALLVSACTPVGVWLIVSGVSLFIHSRIIYFHERQRFLDVRDAQIEARNMSDALAGKPARETGGFVIAESNVRMVKKDAGLKAAFEAIGEEMRGVMTAAA